MQFAEFLNKAYLSLAVIKRAASDSGAIAAGVLAEHKD
jgi:hypothetical protein